MDGDWVAHVTALEVADHGTIEVALSDAAGLIRRRLLLPNSLWGGCEDDAGRSRCEVVAYTECLEGKSAYIVRAIAEGCNYAFEPEELLEYLPKELARCIRAGLMEAGLLSQLASGFGAAKADGEPPDFGAEALNIRGGAVFARARNLHKALWLSRLMGSRFIGTDDELQKEYDCALKRRREAARDHRDRTGRDETGRDRTGRSRPARERQYQEHLGRVPL